MSTTQYIPGAYPGSIPPTPADEPVQQPQYQPPQHETDEHRPHNKLHKANDPRGHAHTDSGVGLTEHEPLRPIKFDQEHWRGPSEAVGGGTYVRDNINEPLTSNDSPRKLEQPSRNIEEEFPSRRNHSTEGAFAATGVAEQGRRVGNQPSNKAEESARRSGQFDGASEAPPYWGALPKAAGGGIYNTVTGHGSANDDHDQHHHLPHRGGVYNTVAGHGSRDEESLTRHSLSQMPDDITTATPANTNRAAHDVHAAAAPSLPKIREGEQKANFDTPTANTAQLNIAPGFPAETAVRDDAALLAAPHPGPAERMQASNDGPNPQQITGTSPRTFPLVATHDTAEPAKQEGRKRSNSKKLEKALPLTSAALIADGASHGLPDKSSNNGQQVQSESQHGRKRSNSKVEKALPMTSASLVADTAAHGLPDKSQTSPTHREGRHGRSASQDQGHHAGGLLPLRSREDKRASSVDKHRMHSEQSPKGEKKSKIFGIFHRNKDESRKEDTSTYEPVTRPDDHHHDHHGKEEAATGGIVGSKSNRNVLRKASKNEGPGGRKTSPEPSSGSEHSDYRREKTAAGIAAGAGAASLLHHKKNNDDLRAEKRQHERTVDNTPLGSTPAPAPAQHATRAQHNPQFSSHTNQPLTSLPVHRETEDVTTPFEHPREPPSPPHASSGQNISSSNTGYGTHIVYNTLSSGKSSTAQRGQSPSHGTPDDTGSRAAVTSQPGHYNTLASGTASGVSGGYSSASRGNNDVVAHEPGNYNVIKSSGAPSGATVSPSEYQNATRDATAHHASNHHVMPFGTAYEENQRQKTRSRSPPNRALGAHVSTTAGRETQASDDYNHLASGTASGVSRDSAHTARAGTATQESAGAAATAKPSVVESFRPTQSRTDSGPYNKLASGTPSGVKVKPKEQRSRQSTEPFIPAHDDQDRTGRERYNSLPSGNTTFGLDQHSQTRPHVDVPDHAQERKDLPLPASSSSPAHAHPSAHHTVFAAPVHAAPETGKQTNPQPPAEQLATPQFTPFPNPELVQNMSPEVMPDSYRESVSSPHHHSSPGYKMSPEVMPAAYSASHAGAVRSDPTASRHGPSGGFVEHDLNSSLEGRTLDQRDRNPALAAATASWPSAAGKSSSQGLWTNSRGKVMHTCEHCGKDNDITRYLKN